MKRAIAILLAAVVVALPGRRAAAQGGVLLQGIVDVEGWATDSNSILLTRNAGRPGGLARMQLWGAVEPLRGVFVFAQGAGVAGNALPFGASGSATALQQAGIRFARDTRWVINVGKVPHPASVFAPRVFSTQNPLIGVPDGYSAVYPLGAMLSGELSRFEYKAGLVDRPLTHRDYVPASSSRLRPVIGIGVAPITGLHIGATVTRGSYLNKNLTDTQLGGEEWYDFQQRLIVGDVEYGIEHLDLRAEYAHGDYDVPNSGTIDGNSGFVEGRYTISPRFFVAGRVESSNYPFIRPVSAAVWQSRRNAFSDWEGGIGFRASESTIIKLTVRSDDWTVTPTNYTFVRPGGKAAAIQVSRAFDVMNWIDRRR